MQPKSNHPRIFWNPLSRWLTLTLPWIGIVGLVIASFFFTDYGWLLLLFTVTWWLLMGYRGYKSLIKKNSAAAIELPEERDNNPKEKFIPQKEWLMDKIPQEDIFSGAIYKQTTSDSAWRLDGTPAKENKNPRYWMLPNSANDGEDWIKLQRNIQLDDEVWTFSSTETKIKSPFHWAGVCLIRQGEIVDCVAEEMHLSFRK